MPHDPFEDTKLDADAELTRAELVATVEALHRKISPRHQIEHVTADARRRLSALPTWLILHRMTALPVVLPVAAGLVLVAVRYQHRKARAR